MFFQFGGNELTRGEMYVLFVAGVENQATAKIGAKTDGEKRHFCCLIISVREDNRVGKGISAQASHRTVLALLNAHGSCCSAYEES